MPSINGLLTTWRNCCESLVKEHDCLNCGCNEPMELLGLFGKQPSRYKQATICNVFAMIEAME